jgi:hypothetical protein
MRLIATLALLGYFAHGHAAEPALSPDLVIHEWGTFTSLQDEQGRTIGGINTDEEKLPAFVHDLDPVRMGKDGDFSPGLIKGRDYCDPSVTMRLETPVIYVHLPPGHQQATFDLSVEFRGGILSQYFPLADATVDRQPLRRFGEEIRYGETLKSANGRGQQMRFSQRWFAPELSATTTSTLTWRGIVVGGTGNVPNTTSPVWLAPRQVTAPTLTVGDEREKYLFYRGLGHLDAPLITKRSDDGATLTVSPRTNLEASGWTANYLPRLWLADVRSDGTAAFRTVEPLGLHRQNDHTPIATQTFPASFVEADFSAERLRLLQQELHAGLMQYGLFADEAQALLSTWEASYFKSPGQRLFFLVPKRWTDHVLPLTTSVPATVIRAMMGRIELVSPKQRQALQRIADGPVSDRTWFNQFVHDHIRYLDGEKLVYRPGGQALDRRMFVDNERGLLAELKVTPPADYQAYLSLGRFRDALLWDAQIHAPDPERVEFLRTYQVVWAPMGWRWEALNRKAPDKVSAR